MLLAPIKKHGLTGVLKRLPRFFLIKTGLFESYYSFLYPDASFYTNPSQKDLNDIETDLLSNGIPIKDYTIDSSTFHEFVKVVNFPEEYHGGKNSAVWYEKLIEHYIAYDLLGIKSFMSNDIYIDIAACGSPWAKILREDFEKNSYAIDLEIPSQYKELDYYMIQDATVTNFDDSSVKGVSLQCAYEMFVNNKDMDFINELYRILAPGGKAVICPLYMHKEYCFYYSPEYHKSVKSICDNNHYYLNIYAQGVPASRKYNVEKLYERVLDKILSLGMRYQVLVLRNKSELSNDIYCHFILEITR